MTANVKKALSASVIFLALIMLAISVQAVEVRSNSLVSGSVSVENTGVDADVDAAVEADASQRVRQNNSVRINAESAGQRITNSVYVQYSGARQEAVASLGDFNSLRDDLKRANVGAKARLRAQLSAKAREVLLRQVDAMLLRLDAMEESGVSISNRTELKLFFQARKAELEKADSNESVVIRNSQEIRDFWEGHRVEVRKKIALALNEKIEKIIGRAATFSAKFSVRIEDLNATEEDKELLERGIAKLNSDINLFTQVNASLKTRIMQADTSAEVNTVIEQSKRLLRAMHKQLLVDFRLVRALFNAGTEVNSNSRISAQTATEITAASSTQVEVELNEFVQATVNSSINIGGEVQ